ncbi:SidA/IucD/PvdA family monooxygenase [Xenorhabdus nematophila]|uniref:lysine N(6)-hydroxylase/L-ornithine N(5)-oxygenase family protein n=1 Tax=Xenorhabdus nematophila TaxID=628 RepID=UPI0032B74FA9
MNFNNNLIDSPDENKVYDVIGIGFGPSNIALAIALREIAPHMNVAFIESKNHFSWHSGMLFENATMQVSFLKDLVSFRNPRSHFTFINYLYEKKRLAAFSNKKDFFPSRIEFNDYFKWCAEKFSEQVYYDNKVIRITRRNYIEEGHPLLEVQLQVGTEEKTILTKALIHSAGLQPVMPEGVIPSEQVTHVHQLIEQIKKSPPTENSHYVVVGGGQSAAEAVEFLLDQHPSIKVTAIVSRFGYTPADDSPFVNEIFDPNVVDDFYSAPYQVRQNILNLHASTNYAAVDLDLVESLYRGWYEEQVTGNHRLSIERLSRFQSVQKQGERLQVTFSHQLNGGFHHFQCDHLVFATGFTPRNIDHLLDENLKSCLRYEEGLPMLSRHYQLLCHEGSAPLLYSVGISENTHGLTATLISNMAIRAGEIVEDLLAELSGRHYDQAV